MKVWINGKLRDESRAVVSVFDHGFLYGDGIYETVRAYKYRVFHWPEHFKRLKASARSLGLRCPWSSRYLLKGIESTLRSNRSPNASVRITVSRGPGPLGLDPRLCPKPTIAMLLHPDRHLEKLWKTGVTIGIPKVRRNHPLCLDPQIKSNNSLNTIFAKMEGTRMGVFETVLLNLEGHLTEGTTSNIFFAKGNTLFTPALSCGLLRGVTRAEIIRLARRAGYKVREGRYRLKDLRQAEEIFLTSTTLEVIAVNKVLSRSPAPPLPRSTLWHARLGPIATQLHRLYRQAIQFPSKRDTDIR